MIKALLKAFGHAFRGFFLALKTQRNLRIHSFALLVVCTTAYLLACSPLEWALLMLASGTVMAGELFNSAIEAFADKVEPRLDPKIKDTKDMAAGAVLLASLFALVVAGFIFLPKMLHWF